MFCLYYVTALVDHQLVSFMLPSIQCHEASLESQTIIYNATSSTLYLIPCFFFEKLHNMSYLVLARTLLCRNDHVACELKVHHLL